MIRWQQTLLMRKIMSHLNKLDKATRDRHFPESNGGKGSKRRTETNESRKKYQENWDKIFGKKK